jgi:hypothetical protein
MTPWSTRFSEGDRVDWIGPEVPHDPDIPSRGSRGTVIVIDPPDEWVVRWDPDGPMAVYPETHLRRVDDTTL